jgi:hypothetical protein
MSDADLARIAERLRTTARSAGPMHAYWDLIADVEALLAGRPAILERPALEAALIDTLVAEIERLTGELAAEGVAAEDARAEAMWSRDPDKD